MMNRMSKKFIQVRRVESGINMDLLGIAIQIGDREYFVANDQAGWPGIRAGTFPREWDDATGRMMAPDEHEILTVEGVVWKD